MNFKTFVGIDISKSVLDVFIYGLNSHRVFKNNEQGFKDIIQWVLELCVPEPNVDQILIAFEHTGLYSTPLSLFLDQQGYHFTMIPGLELKRSVGISRGKDDKGDSKLIAGYAYEKRERIKLHKVSDHTIRLLQKLFTLRERMVSQRAAYKGRIKEYEAFLNENENGPLFGAHRRTIAFLNAEIKQLDEQMNRLVTEDRHYKKLYEKINTIKGVGPQTTLLMIILTNGFTKFPEWRKFASYAGIAPFPNQSGAFKGRTKVNHIANKKIKALLSSCALSAIHHNIEMKLYFEKRMGEGKNKMSTINIVRNKILSRIFAVAKRQAPYVEFANYAQ